MYSYIRGELVEIQQDFIVVEAGQIGYEIRIPASRMGRLARTGQPVKVYTYLHVKEGLMELYGFLSRDDLHIFKLLLGVNGIGPKGALAVLAALTPDDLRFAVLGEDFKAIAKAPGIGSKTAQRIVLELKDKLGAAYPYAKEGEEGQGKGEDALAHVKAEAVQALVALGYSSSEAWKSVGKAEAAAGSSVEEVLKLSLKQMSVL
ncbi:MAG: Holliday junction branch migration protein RuvA [Lachnospiraceae bacterium]|jgi:Holliday junction DNA helicase RuvA|nr:Holliday junction branch migration protein RuvA [Lachnospiraceae bacterium]